ncbi:MAG: hypothetical protein QXS41_01030 [Candidatus Woesearchaeota archaeon]
MVEYQENKDNQEHLPISQARNLQLPSHFSSNSQQKKPTFKHQQIPQHRDIEHFKLNEVRKKVQERIDLFSKLITSLRRYIEIKKELIDLLKDLEKESSEKEERIKEYQKIILKFNEELSKVKEEAKNPQEFQQKQLQYYNRLSEKQREIENLFKQNGDHFIRRSKSIINSYNEFISKDEEILNYILTPENFRKFIEENEKILNVLKLQMRESNSKNIDNKNGASQ